MLCLICGDMLCTNSYCCQKVVDEGEEQSDEEKLRIGGFTQHAQRYSHVGFVEIAGKRGRESRDKRRKERRGRKGAREGMEGERERRQEREEKGRETREGERW